jgi:endonuclease-3 related protein
MKKLMDIHNSLLAHFGPRNWWPMQRGFSPVEWEVEVGAVLTQNTNWKNVEIALKNLKKSGIVSREKTMKISEKELEKLIRPSGYYRQKARKLKLLAGFKGSVTRENLLLIWGIGRETVDSILLYAYGKLYFVVDAYTVRIFSRLGLIGDDWNYERTREFFENNLPKNTKLYKEFHALIVELGKNFCKKKPLCKGCPVSSSCGMPNQDQNRNML